MKHIGKNERPRGYCLLQLKWHFFMYEVCAGNVLGTFKKISSFSNIG
jgi:hypothetical protein